MPKKRAPWASFSKPQGSVHPSLSSSSTEDRHGRSESDKSVNGILQHLRVSQAASATLNQPRLDANPQTVHPLLRAILQVPETPSPRPRPGARPSGIRRNNRGPAGPAPPRSWVTQSSQNLSHKGIRPWSEGPVGREERISHKELGAFPDQYLPDKNSLLHQTLISLAKRWYFHVDYDQYYLATLPVRYKQALLAYIAGYNSFGISQQGLSILFQDEHELPGATGGDTLTHLDLSGSIGGSLPFNLLLKYLVTTSSTSPSTPPESWDDQTSSFPSSLPLKTLTFPSLTHLSLSNPTPHPLLWKHLLNLTPHLPTLTHLALAHWPTPSLTPNSKTAFRSTPQGDVAYGTSTLYSSTLDNDHSGAAALLRRLSRDLYCLQYLDVRGCADWVPALACRDGPEWTGSWGAVDVVRIGQDWLPACLKEEGYAWRDILQGYGTAEELELRSWIRTEIGLGSVRFRILAMTEKTISRKSNVTVRAEEERRRAGWRTGAAAESGWGDDEEGEEGNEESGVGAEVRSGRRCILKFDRGWDGWWIDECLQACKERERIVDVDSFLD